MGEIGEGAFLDLAVLAIGLAEQGSGRRIAVGDCFDIHGYIIISVVSLYSLIIAHKKLNHKICKNLLGTLLHPQNLCKPHGYWLKAPKMW